MLVSDGLRCTSHISDMDPMSSVMFLRSMAHVLIHLFAIQTVSLACLCILQFPPASHLVSQVLDFARSLRTCKGVYLHVVDYNLPAIRLYERLHFICLRRLPDFYQLEGSDYTALLYIFYLNGGSPPSEASR